MALAEYAKGGFQNPDQLQTALQKVRKRAQGKSNKEASKQGNAANEPTDGAEPSILLYNLAL
eukprot:CAMPEP_0194589914 /NCGR_PEP_ID=MMETSP0292-20121207/20969_1 /TAXON_ID=39354 /ORGANISM="Heterosigma akashiwo, Strain CCMP2393" /LENGTH=61 /DNA_ID=CAMNT_0039447319 /DNA_START=235 /DNA_END=417 /DNA_ORIENTATION=-